MAEFKRFASGDKLRPSAQQVNAWTDASLHFAQNDPTLSLDRQFRFIDESHKSISNNSGGTLEPYSILQVSGVAVTPSVDEPTYKNRIVFEGDEPSTDDSEKFAITQRALQHGDVDPVAVVAGVSYVRLTGPANKDKATVKNGQTTLEAGDSGPCVIMYDPGPADEERVAVVRIGGGGGSSCQDQFALWFSGDPTGGSTVLPLNIDGTTENVTINFDAEGTAPDAYAGSAAAYVDSALATHSEVTVDDVVVTTAGGSLPRQVVRFYFTGDVSMDDVTIGDQVDSFTGGDNPHSTLDRCCG